MNIECYRECLKFKQESNGKPFWGELAKKYGYSSAEAFRSSFRRFEKNNKGKLDDVVVSQAKEKLPFKPFVFDIENSLAEAYVFDTGEQYIKYDQIKRQPFILCWAGKLLNDPNVVADCISPEEAKDGNDYRVVKSAWENLNGMDVVIGHNVRAFDLRKMNARFIYYGLPPLNNFHTVDTLMVARKEFNFLSNSLGALADYLGVEKKIENEGLPLWKRCTEGDGESLKIMDNYCRGDIISTEGIYLKLRPFVRGHVNLSMYYDDCNERCPNCGSDNLSANEYQYAITSRYESVRCENCGAISRRKVNLLSKDKKSSLLRN